MTDSAALPGANGNGGNGLPSGGAAASEQSEPRFGILLQYVKDVSFENVNPIGVFVQDQHKDPPNITVAFDVNVQQIDSERWEVSLKVRANAKVRDANAYIVEVENAAVVGMRNIPADHQGPLLHIEVPRLLFPFSRALIADLTREGNYSALMVNSIDLLKLYQSKLEKAEKTDQAESSVA